MGSAEDADRLVVAMKVDVWEIRMRVNTKGNKEFDNKFGLYFMSLKSRMGWGLAQGIITQEEHDAVKETYKADDYWQWEYAE